MAFRNLAFVRFPNREIVGAGRYAIDAIDSPEKIWLFETREEAERQILNPKRVKVVDLLAPVTPVGRVYRNPADQEKDPY
jgi:hypothetical protein